MPANRLSVPEKPALAFNTPRTGNARPRLAPSRSKSRASICNDRSRGTSGAIGPAAPSARRLPTGSDALALTIRWVFSQAVTAGTSSIVPFQSARPSARHGPALAVSRLSEIASPEWLTAASNPSASGTPSIRRPRTITDPAPSTEEAPSSPRASQSMVADPPRSAGPPKAVLQPDNRATAGSAACNCAETGARPPASVARPDPVTAFSESNRTARSSTMASPSANWARRRSDSSPACLILIPAACTSRGTTESRPVARTRRPPMNLRPSRRHHGSCRRPRQAGPRFHRHRRQIPAIRRPRGLKPLVPAQVEPAGRTQHVGRIESWLPPSPAGGRHRWSSPPRSRARPAARARRFPCLRQVADAAVNAPLRHRHLGPARRPTAHRRTPQAAIPPVPGHLEIQRSPARRSSRHSGPRRGHGGRARTTRRGPPGGHPAFRQREYAVLEDRGGARRSLRAIQPEPAWRRSPITRRRS